MLNLSCKKTYDGKVVLDVGGLIFEKGKRYAVIGSNGSGKTTLLKIIGGVIKPDKNAIFETDFAGGGNTICYMSQTSYAFDMSLKRNVYVACPDLPRIKSRDTRLYYKNRCNDLIRDMGLWELKNKNALKLSGGETQRMALCRVFADKHEVLLLDEPTSAMDVAATAVAENMLDNYCAEFSPIVIFATHSVNQALRLADEVLFLSNGILTERGDPREILLNPKTEKLKSFLSNV